MLNRTFNALSEEIAGWGDKPVPGRGDTVQQLEEENRLLRAVIDNFPGGLSLFDRNLRLILCNEQQKKLLGYPPNLFEYGTPTLEQLFRFNATRGEYGPGDIEKHVADRMALVHRRSAHVFERTRPNGTVLQIRGVPLAGGGFLTTYLDVTEQRKPRQADTISADLDVLTGLPGRILFRERMKKVLVRVQRGHVAAIHCLDLDHFKDINARHGRDVGDQLLKTIGARLQVLVRGSDTAARIGGDRFAVLQPDIARPSDVARLATRLLEAVRHPCEAGGQTITLSASIGMALAPRDGSDFEPLMAKAEAAVLSTKSRHRGHFDAAAIGWK